MNKFISVQQAVDMIKDGDTIMVGGFLTVGTPLRIIDALAASGKKNLTLISNDTGYIDRGVGKLITNKQISKLYVSHIGTNQNTMDQMNAGELKVEFCPQGSLAERIRCGGAGLGGVLTATGLGTVVAEGKQVVNVDGKDYLLEKPLRADFALIGASKGDSEGNLIYRGTSQNFNPMMAMAAKTVIAEINELVEPGQIEPEAVITPSILVKYIVR